MLTTVEKLIIDARLQAAAEQAWREAIELHHVEVWKPGRILSLPLRMMNGSISAGHYGGTEPPQLSPDPIAYGEAEFLTMGSRVVFIARHYGTDWSWIACRFTWCGEIEHNYTL